MNHFKATGALSQIEFLLSVRTIFEEIKNDPEKRDSILKKSTLFDNLKNLFKLVFTGKRREDEEITLESLKKSVFDIGSSVEEVNELKNGILREYREIT